MNTLTGTKEFLQVLKKLSLKGKKVRTLWHSAIMMRKRS